MWIDNSKLDYFYLCPQKYAYRFEEHLVPLDRKRDSPLLFGGAIHSALETYYRGTGLERVPCPLCTQGCFRCKGNPMPRLAATFLAHYTDDPDEPREIRTVDRGLELLSMYLAKWRREPFKVLEVERPFSLLLSTEHSDLEFEYTGRIDLIIDYDDVVMPLDHKTTTRFGLVFDSSFKLSGQFTGYMLGTQRLTGRAVTSACANALRLTTRIGDDSFARIFTHRTPDEFDQWEWNVRHTVDQIVSLREANAWPRNAPFACGAYNRICEYYPLCIAGPQTREHLKQTAYEVSPWEPRKVDE